MIPPERLLELCAEGVEAAAKRGADQAEVYAEAHENAQVELQKDDIHTATTEEEVCFGVRVFRAGSLGFATVNGREHLETACDEAMAMARATPPDVLNGLAEPQPVTALENGPDPRLGTLDISELVRFAAGLLERVKQLDARVRIDGGGVGVRMQHRAIATSTGIRLCEAHGAAGGQLFGMAVDGDDVGSFDYDGIQLPRAADLQPELEALARRFVEKCVGALGARKGESFRGTVVLVPEVVGEFVLGNLIAILTGKAVRTGKCALADRVGRPVASDALTLREDARLAEATQRSAFDREGTPTRTTSILERGHLSGFLYDVYEARAAGVTPTGHARGGATSAPLIGPSNLVLEPGGTPFAALCQEPSRGVLVNRLSGSTNPITGEFSGVVKGGFLIDHGERRPIRETLIAGNLFDLLRSVSGVSQERRNLLGRAWLPALRVEDVSVTAG